MDEINTIALKYKIQSSDIKCQGIGSAKKEIEDEHGNLVEAQTFFFIAHSNNLLKIRKEIQQLYIEKGGSANDFNPDDFYPHITIGYLERDLHSSDGIIKNSENCLDKRFKVQILDK